MSQHLPLLRPCRCPDCNAEQPEPGTCGRCPGTVKVVTPLEFDVRRAFRMWCAEADIAVDYDAPHWEAFHAGYECGSEDEYNRYLRSAVT